LKIFLSLTENCRQRELNACVLTDIGLECLATWKDGSEMFYYGRLSAAGIVDKEDKYRCFV